MAGKVSDDGAHIGTAARTAAAIRLIDRARRLGDDALLNQAVTQFKQILSATSPTDPNHEVAVANLATGLITQFEWTGKAEALDEAIRLLRQAAAHPFSTKAGQAACQGILGWALLREAERSGDVATIKKAVAARRRALRLTGKLELLYTERLSDLGGVLAHQFSMTGDLGAISEAIAVHKAAVSQTLPYDPQLAIRLTNMGTALGRLAMRTGDKGDLRRAVDAHRQAVVATQPGDPAEAMQLSNLGNALMRDYEENGSRAALDEAVACHRAALAATPEHHVQREPHRTNLAAALLSLYERTGGLAVLDEVVDLYRQSVGNTPRDHTNGARYLYGLASALARRTEHTGDLASVDEAVALLHDVVELTPDGHPNRPGRLSALATAKYLRFLESPSEISQLDSAISTLREAFELTPKGHPQRAQILSNLGGLLDARFERTNDPESLYVAIDHHREAVAATSMDHSERGRRLSNLVLSLIHQSRLTDDDFVLDEALQVCRQALESLLPGDFGRAQTLLGLGAAYERRFELANNAAALSAGIAAFREAADDGTAPAQLRIKAGRDGGRLAASAGAIGDALKAFGTAVRLADEAAWIGIGKEDQERLLGQMSGLPMDAAAIAIEAGDPEQAVELLEQGRGVLLARQLEIPGQHAALRERAPALAEQLAELQLALDMPAASVPTAEEARPHRAEALQTAADRRSELARQRDLLIEQMRAQADLQDLVSPPEFSRLRLAAGRGPVVIVNVSTYRCDALVVSTDHVRVVPLPALSAKTVNECADALLKAADKASRDVTTALHWLWDFIVEPIFSDLGLTSRPQSGRPPPHLWWCCTGASAFLPLHAAGNYSEGTLSRDTALDLVVSSYTPTLRTLIQLREPRPELLTAEAGPLIIAMPETPGAAELPGAETEAEDVASRFTASARLSGPSATHAAVTESMRQHPWAHFACHGTQNPAAPSQGRLLMYDQPLTIQQIMALGLTNASFAYLSACDTYRGGTDIPDESITLASALQLAGYRHVIATMWQISGLTASDIARRVYDQIVKDDNRTTVIDVNAVAAALRAAINALREESPEIPPMYWAAYIHTGP